MKEEAVRPSWGDSSCLQDREGKVEVLLLYVAFEKLSGSREITLNTANTPWQ
jgi:hypothetical protein